MRPGEIPGPTERSRTDPRAASNVSELDTGDNRATLKSRSERGCPGLSDLQVGLRARIWKVTCAAAPRGQRTQCAVAPPSERKCAPSSLLDNGIGTAKSQCGWLSGPIWRRQSRSQCTRTDNKTVLVPVGVSFTVSRHQLSRLKRRYDRRRDLDGEFDPGSGRTLAACLTHASRTESIWWQHR